MHKGKERMKKHPTQLHELPNFLEMKHNYLMLVFYSIM